MGGGQIVRIATSAYPVKGQADPAPGHPIALTSAPSMTSVTLINMGSSSGRESAKLTLTV